MAWSAARSVGAPAIDLRSLRARAPVAVGLCCVSLAGSRLWTSRSKPFACINAAISTNPTSVANAGISPSSFPALSLSISL